MGKNRDRVSLIAAILSAAGSGSSKTRIMFAANLSFKLLEKYLKTSLNLGFIQTKGSGYELTLKGHDFLRQYLSFEERYNKAQDSLNFLSSERARLEQLCLKCPQDMKPEMAEANKSQNNVADLRNSRFREKTEVSSIEQ